MSAARLPPETRGVRSPNVPAGAVVVGVDGSPGSDRAVAWGAATAEQENRPLVLVHALHLSGPWFAGTGADLRVLRERVTHAGIVLLRETRRGVLLKHPALPVRTICRVETARDLLVELSDAAHLLVLGSRGRGRVGSLVLGSVSAAVLRHAHCPVVVLRSDEPCPAGHGVVAGIATDEESQAILDFAFHDASGQHEALTVVHCLGDAPSTADDFLAVSECLAGLRETYPDVDVRVELVHGAPEDVLADLADDASLVVVGSREHGVLVDVALGTVATSLVQRAHCPVAVVPQQVGAGS